jgi:hypothetical protein
MKLECAGQRSVLADLNLIEFSHLAASCLENHCAGGRLRVIAGYSDESWRMSGSYSATGEGQISIDDTGSADSAALNFRDADDSHKVEVNRAIRLDETR